MKKNVWGIRVSDRIIGLLNDFKKLTIPVLESNYDLDLSTYEIIIMALNYTSRNKNSLERVRNIVDSGVSRFVFQEEDPILRAFFGEFGMTFSVPYKKEDEETIEHIMSLVKSRNRSVILRAIIEAALLDVGSVTDLLVYLLSSFNLLTRTLAYARSLNDRNVASVINDWKSDIIRFKFPFTVSSNIEAENLTDLFDIVEKRDLEFPQKRSSWIYREKSIYHHLSDEYLEGSGKIEFPFSLRDGLMSIYLNIRADLMLEIGCKFISIIHLEMKNTEIEKVHPPPSLAVTILNLLEKNNKERIELTDVKDSFNEVIVPLLKENFKQIKKQIMA